MYMLKDYPNHQEAFVSARSRVADLDYFSGHFLSFEYVMQLKRLDEKAVNVIEAWKERPDVGDGLIYAALFPYAAADYTNAELPGDIPLEWLFLSVDSHAVHNKSRAAKYCGTSIRQLERWMKNGLPFSKIGKERLFLEKDLWDYMTTWGVGQRVHDQRDYVEGQIF